MRTLALALAALVLAAPSVAAASLVDETLAPHESPVQAQASTPLSSASAPASALPDAPPVRARAPTIAAPDLHPKLLLAHARTNGVDTAHVSDARLDVGTVPLAGVMLRAQAHGDALTPAGPLARAARADASPFGRGEPTLGLARTTSVGRASSTVSSTTFEGQRDAASISVNDDDASSPTTPRPPPAAPPNAHHPSPTALAAAAAATGAAVLLVVAPWALYHRFRAIEQHKRGELVELLRAQPGLTQADVARAMGCDASTARYHLRRLAKDGALVEHDRRWFAAGAMPPRERATLVATSGGSDRALDAIRATPGLTLSELAARLGVARTAASWHLRKLAGAGLVRVERDGRALRIRPA